MALALQQFINGLTLGAVYGLIAIGYTMVYGIIGMINFAHGDIYMVSAFIAVTGFTLLTAFGVNSVVFAMVVVLIVGGVVYLRLRLGGGTPGLPSAARIDPAGTAHFGDRHVDLPAEHGAADPRRARQADPPMITGGVDLLTTDGFTARLSYSQILIVLVTIALITGFTWLITQDFVWPSATRMRAGPHDDRAARDQRRPHDLADLHARRRARRRRRGDGH
jgi:branched-chain amino acid transport system permease protein